VDFGVHVRPYRLAPGTLHGSVDATENGDGDGGDAVAADARDAGPIDAATSDTARPDAPSVEESGVATETESTFQCERPERSRRRSDGAPLADAITEGGIDANGGRSDPRREHATRLHPDPNSGSHPVAPCIAIGS